MNFFDSAIIHYLNSFSEKSKDFDLFILYIVDNNFVKGVALVSALWFFWFHESVKKTENREKIVMCIFSCLVAVGFARGLALSLPFRFRPIVDPGINFIKPFGAARLSSETWSSFPSDNATMFFSLATGIFLVSRKAGIFAYLYVLVIVCFPRIYLGVHYPTDILAGSIIGTLITLILSAKNISKPVTKLVFQFKSKYEGIFYTLTFILIYEVANLFLDIRIAGHQLFAMFGS